MFLFCKSVHVRRFISENQCFFELWINHLLEVLLEKSLLAFLNFMFLTMVIKSFSNAKTYLTCFGECNAFSSYLSTLPFCLHLVLYIIVFNLILFIFSSIFSTNCNLQFHSNEKYFWLSNCSFLLHFVNE